MYSNIYSNNSGVHHSWYRRNVLSSIGRNKALEKWQYMRVHYRYQFDWFKKVIGLGLIITSTTLMVLNERLAIENSQSYHEGLKLVRLITNPNTISPENEGKLVHVTGYLDIPELLEDYPYGVSIYAVKLKRRIQMFQWDEERVTHADNFIQPQYQYKKVWRDKLIDSKNFAIPENHQNPRHMPVRSEIRVNPVVRLGEFMLGQELKEKFNDFTQFTSGERPDSSNVKMHMGLYYHATDIWNPSVGDIRIQFSFAVPADSFVSMIARQSGRTLTPFQLNSGQSILYMHEGNKSHFDIFTKEHSSLIFYIWIFRTAIWTTTIVGSFLASKIILRANRRNFFLKNLMLLEPAKLSLILTCFLSLMTMGCVWCQYKPLFGFLQIILASCIILYYVIIPSESDKPSIIMYSNNSEDKISNPESLSTTKKNYGNCT